MSGSAHNSGMDAAHHIIEVEMLDLSRKVYPGKSDDEWYNLGDFMEDTKGPSSTFFVLIDKAVEFYRSLDNYVPYTPTESSPMKKKQIVNGSYRYAPLTPPPPPPEKVMDWRVVVARSVSALSRFLPRFLAVTVLTLFVASFVWSWVVPVTSVDVGLIRFFTSAFWAAMLVLGLQKLQKWSKNFESKPLFKEKEKNK